MASTNSDEFVHRQFDAVLLDAEDGKIPREDERFWAKNGDGPGENDETLQSFILPDQAPWAVGGVVEKVYVLAGEVGKGESIDHDRGSDDCGEDRGER
jgi:hypothetical protein